MHTHEDTCRNCGCTAARRRFKRRDCCGKCFYLFEYLKLVERWDLRRPETLKQVSTMDRRFGGVPVPSLPGMSGEDFAVFKTSYIEQIKVALDQLRVREARRRGELPADGATIEHKLKDMLKLMQLRDKYERAAARLHGLAGVLDHAFSPEQCRILYSVLDDIEEQTYARVAASYKALEAIYQSKQKARLPSPHTVPAMMQLAPAPAGVEPASAYQPHDIVRRVQQGSRVSVFGRIVRLPKSLCGRDIALRATARDGVFDVVFESEIITVLDMRTVGHELRGASPLPAPGGHPALGYSIEAGDRPSVAS